MQDKLTNKFIKDGFVNIGKILDHSDVIYLKEKCLKLLNETDKTDFYKKINKTSYYRPVLDNKDWAVLENLIGLSDKFDTIMEKFFNNQKFKSVLESVIGKNYKLWTCSVRLAKGEDSGLGFHNDRAGEVGVTILLENQLDEKGTTSVIAGSHKWPVTSQETKSESIPTSFLKPFSKPITGEAGETFLFFKKTLHGRIAHKSKKSGLAIMIGIYPVGYTFTPYKVPDEILNKVGPESKRLMSDDNLKLINNIGEYLITGEKQKNFIDELRSLKLKFYSPFNLVKLYPKLIVTPVQGVKRIIKKIF